MTKITIYPQKYEKKPQNVAADVWQVSCVHI